MQHVFSQERKSSNRIGLNSKAMQFVFVKALHLCNSVILVTYVNSFAFDAQLPQNNRLKYSIVYQSLKRLAKDSFPR